MYETEAEREAFFKPLIQYRQEKVLGEGAFGVAIQALHEIEQRKKVFKLPKTSKTIEALKAEGKNLVKLRDLLHPNIIQLHEFGKVQVEWKGKSEERYYLILAFGGHSLRDEVGDLRAQYDRDGNARYEGSGKRLPVDKGLKIAIDVCQGLEAAHGFKDPDVRMIHRDIKPENILIDDKTGIARITDFGIARVIDRSSGLASAAGTLLYMDPACFKGRAGTYSDIYSLGFVLYEMLTGSIPFADFVARVDGKPKDPRELNPEVPEDLSGIILKSLEAEPEKRHGSTTEMLDDLKRVAAALNPLPERYSKVSQLGSSRFMCDDEETRERGVVQLVECDATKAAMADQMAALDDLGDDIVGPVRHFRREHILGVVWPQPSGKPLAEWAGPVPVGTVDRVARLCGVMAEACGLVGRANERGIVHGSLTPDSIRCGAKGRVSIHGFGTAPALAARRPGKAGARAVLEGFRDRLAFMSPQVLAGESPPAEKDDVYCLGAVLLHMLTGRPPVDQKTAEAMASGKTVARPALNPQKVNPLVTQRLLAVIEKALAWNVHDRYAHAADIAAALGKCRWPEDVVETLIADALRAQKAGDVVEAYELLERALEADPGNAEVHSARGRIYFEEGEFKWAAKELQGAAEVSPGRDLYVLLGRCFLKLEDPKQAAGALEEALQQGDGGEEPAARSRKAEVHDLLAKALRELGEASRAAEEMRRAAELEPDESVAERRRAQLKGWEGSPDRS